MIITPTRRQFIYSVNDFSSDRHTAQFNEEQLLKVIDNIGKEKIAAIVSDAESAMMAAKRRIVSNYKHILPVRCVAHHINLVTKDITSLDWAKKTLKKCQKIVSFFHKSHCAGAALCDEIINSLVFGGNLKSSVKTHWSTSWDVCESILCLETNIKFVSILKFFFIFFYKL